MSPNLRLALTAGLVAPLSLLAAAAATTAASPAPSLAYRITPQFQDGALVALDVEMTGPGAPGGVDILDLPENAGDRLTAADIRAEGAQIADLGGGRLRLTRAPGAPLRVAYRIRSAFAADPDDQEPMGPLVRPDWFVVRGDVALVVPEGAPQARARVTLAPFPAGWTAASSLSGEVPSSRLDSSLLIGGRGWRMASRPVAGAPLRLVYPPQREAQAASLLDRAARVLAAERAFWRAPGAPFLVGLVPLKDDGSAGGRAFVGGYEVFVGARPPAGVLLHHIAHENMHSWISQAIGGFPKTDSDLEAWLNEGFTEAMTARILLSAGLWSLDDFVADENQSLLRYGVSPVKTEPNSRILKDRMRDTDVNKLPYDRGRLLALLWDRELRARTGGRLGLVDVLRAQAGEAGRRPDGPSADQLFPVMARRTAGVDLDGEIRRYVEKGEAVELPEDLFGPCARIVYASQPVFDRGFNLGATLRANARVQELEPGGPAERAGLRAGDHILIDEAFTRDSRVTLAYVVVEPGGGRRVVRYRPEGSTQVRFQQIELTPLAQRDPARCRAEMARP